MKRLFLTALLWCGLSFASEECSLGDGPCNDGVIVEGAPVPQFLDIPRLGIVEGFVLPTADGTVSPFPIPNPCKNNNPCVTYSQMLYYAATGSTLTFVTGDSNLGVPTDYILEVQEFPPKDGGIPLATVVRHTPASTLTYPVLFPKAGLYYVRAKACQGVNADGTPNCSRWANSWDPIDTGTSTPQGWFVYIYLKGVTDGGVH